MVRLLGAIFLLVGALPAWANYVVERGDVLFVSIAEQPDASREAKVNADGRIMLPQLGGIEAAGSDLDTIQTRIEQALAQRDIVRKATVVVEVAAYRPFYVGGAVARPGAIAFEPGLTVRHALVLAGGLERSDDPVRPTTTELLELKAQWRAGSFALLQTKTRIARLEAELAERPEPDLASVDASFVPPATAAEVQALDAGLFDDRAEARAANREHLKDLLALVDFEIDVLGRQAAHQEHERDLQNAEVVNARELHDKGLIPLPRLQELEREESRLSRDLLENQAFAARARQTKATARYDLAAADTLWRTGVREDLTTALLEREQLEAEIDVLTGRLIAAGIALTDDGALGTPSAEVTIHRLVAGKGESLAATMDTELQPGDVLDVALAGIPNG